MLTPPADFVIAASFMLPGLGMLVLATSPPPAWLADYPLHTALSIALLAEGVPPISLTGTVEELSRDDQPAQRALLLDFAPDGALPLGTCLQLDKAQPHPW